MLELRVHEKVEPTTEARLSGVVAHQHTLRDVVAWMAAAGGTPSIVTIIEQDEFTSDVVVRESDGVFLVYDCT
ncbi:MAG: hypothetical protein AAF799_17735 [Myxococcota bacterium]